MGSVQVVRFQAATPTRVQRRDPSMKRRLFKPLKRSFVSCLAWCFMSCPVFVVLSCLCCFVLVCFCLMSCLVFVYVSHVLSCVLPYDVVKTQGTQCGENFRLPFVGTWSIAFAALHSSRKRVGPVPNWRSTQTGGRGKLCSSLPKWFDPNPDPCPIL